MPQSEIAAVPVYELPTSVASLVRAPRVPPRVTPEIVLAERKFVPIEVVATTPPLAFVERSALLRFTKPKVVVVAFVVVELLAVKLSITLGFVGVEDAKKAV